jgi:flagellar biosynthetic protein FlhB
MAEGDDSDRTESPTQKRLDDARKRGQVPRSRDLSAAAVTLAGGIGLSSVGSLLGGGLANLMRSSLSFRGVEAMDDGQMLVTLGHAAAQAAIAVAPILGILLAAAVLAPLAIGGWNFSAEALAPDFSRLDPIAGIARVFSLQGLFELLKSLARFGVVAGVAVIVLRHQFHTYAQLGTEPVRAGILHAISMAGSALIALGGGLALIAGVDVPLALWQYHRGLRMSREEIRQEARESEGSPEVRQRVRQVQQEMSRKRMMSDVPKADVVITNPTHYAVALRYDEKRMRAPVVVAKGADLIAQRIREIATENGVPLVEAPPLARALHGGCDVGDEIPARLYAAVAQVLTYVYQLRVARRVGYGTPTPPRIDSVPPEA